MRKLWKLVLFLVMANVAATAGATDTADNVLIAVHGGAGGLPADLTPEQEAAYERGLRAALEAGGKVLGEGGDSMDAVIAAVTVLEDDPLFNAGRGAVLNCMGEAELDASVMDGASGRGGAVAAVRHVRNPARLAHAVMEHTGHVMLAGRGAFEFALERGLPVAPQDYFRTPQRMARVTPVVDCARPPALVEGGGTVGAIARDAEGHLAAATSTGGRSGKRVGRVGDSPILGAGTWADERVAISGTGHGEYFMRGLTAYDIAARMHCLEQPLAEAVRGTMQATLAERGGSGGVIALDRDGGLVVGFNTSTIKRGWLTADGDIVVGIRPEPIAAGQ